ncbi:unnamed protein product [Boreogadus saida]
MCVGAQTWNHGNVTHIVFSVFGLESALGASLPPDDNGAARTRYHCGKDETPARLGGPSDGGDYHPTEFEAETPSRQEESVGNPRLSLASPGYLPGSLEDATTCAFPCEEEELRDYQPPLQLRAQILSLLPQICRVLSPGHLRRERPPSRLALMERRTIWREALPKILWAWFFHPLMTVGPSLKQIMDVS